MRRALYLSTLLLWVVACGDDEVREEAADTGVVTRADAGPSGSGVQVALDASVSRTLDASLPTGTMRKDASVLPSADGAVASLEVPCIDEQIAQLMLFEAPATGAITEEGTQPGIFVTHIDATAGGLTATQGFIYARFSDRGLERVALGDEDAFASTDWHIALRRYVIRINSGVSGPGSVLAARTAPDTKFEQLSAVPSGLAYRTEEYFTKSCEFVPDTSGVGAPASALSSFWSYSSCLAMTYNVYVIALPNGRHVKLQVLAYYTLENQKRCNETGMFSSPSGAGNLRVKWAFLD